MRSFFLLILIATSWPDALAQSSLPPCPTDSSVVWTNCFGTQRFSDAEEYIGGWRNNEPYGKGSLISLTSAQKHTIVEGKWQDTHTVVTSAGSVRRTAATTGATFFVFTDSIRRDGAFRRAWLMIAYHERLEETGTLSAKVLMKFDCAGERYSGVSGTNFYGPFGSGAVVSILGEMPWDYAAPGTAFTNVATYICKYRLPARQ